MERRPLGLWPWGLRRCLWRLLLWRRLKRTGLGSLLLETLRCERLGERLEARRHLVGWKLSTRIEAGNLRLESLGLRIQARRRAVFAFRLPSFVTVRAFALVGLSRPRWALDALAGCLAVVFRTFAFVLLLLWVHPLAGS